MRKLNVLTLFLIFSNTSCLLEQDFDEYLSKGILFIKNAKILLAEKICECPVFDTIPPTTISPQKKQSRKLCANFRTCGKYPQFSVQLISPHNSIHQTTSSM